jgi:hypothetical protein
LNPTDLGKNNSIQKINFELFCHPSVTKHRIFYFLSCVWSLDRSSTRKQSFDNIHRTIQSDSRGILSLLLASFGLMPDQQIALESIFEPK